MPSQKRRIPKYRHYKPKDLGVVRLEGRDRYLGKYDSAASWEAYHRAVAAWLQGAQDGALSTVPNSSGIACEDISINRLILKYWEFALGYYRKNGRLSGETVNIRAAIKPLRHLYGSTPA